MKVISSYKVKLQSESAALAATTKIYREAVAFLIDVIDTEWETLQPVYKESTHRGQVAVEKLTHRTKKNPTPKYDFDTPFYKFPSYFRRAAISAALGAVSSYRSQVENWEASDKAGRKPKLTLTRSVTPVFYRNDMGRYDAMLKGETNQVELKLYDNSDWRWVKIPCRWQDIKYLIRYWSAVEADVPSLVSKKKSPGKYAYYLNFPFEEQRDLSEKDTTLEERTILAVDLGINSDAVCSIMRSDGTVVARKFINFAAEKDQMNHLLNRIKKLQRKHGSKTGGRHEWANVRRLNEDLARKISGAIVDFAALYDATVIVFEYLDIKGKKQGSKKQRLHMWRKMDIQHRVEHKAHRNLIRISRICAWGTSALAFDGSGKLKRDKDNRAWATFATGKRYNCDLSASYNIGARYFLREWCNENSELKEALPKASRRTYSDLRNLFAAPVAA